MNNNLIIKHLRQYKPKDILDYGCGTGSLPYEDYPELNFTAADKRGLESQLSSYENVNFVEIDDHKTQSFIPFSDNQFDFIILRFVLEHVPNPLFYIKEAERISKSGGRIFISVPNYKSFQDRIFRLATKIAGSKQGPHIQKFTFFNINQLIYDDSNLRLEDFFVSESGFTFMLSNPILKYFHKTWLKYLNYLKKVGFNLLKDSDYYLLYINCK